MKNTTIKVNMLLTALCLLVCLSGCQNKGVQADKNVVTPLHKLGEERKGEAHPKTFDSSLHKISEVIFEEVRDIYAFALNRQLFALLYAEEVPQSIDARRKICRTKLLHDAKNWLDDLKRRIDGIVQAALSANPEALNVEGTTGFVPANQLLFDLLNRIHAQRIWGDMYEGEEVLLDQAFAYALEKLRTDKRTKPSESRYLGLIEKEMSLDEFRARLFPNGYNLPNVMAVKLD